MFKQVTVIDVLRPSGCLALLLFFSLGPHAARAEEPVDFNQAVRPILAKHCLSCHGPDEDAREAGLRLDVREGAIMELDSGERAITPGDSAASELIRRVTTAVEDERMPPEGEGVPLTEPEIAILRRWIDEGAKWAQHWAYLPPQPPTPPQVQNQSWARSELDLFVLASLERAGLQPMPEANRYKLLRRVTLDLTGLPPTLREIEDFVGDRRPDAYERLVDRLLKSSAYGERWARVWLDLARYADTNGYEKDARRTIWPYRDWVIQALNRDLPFDRFTIEQMAGDLLSDPTPEQVIATAFHRNTMTNTEGGTDDEEFRDAAVMDRINTTMQVWMGATFGCCQCHSHKYDPLTQADYYRFFAVFNQTEDNDQPDNRPTFDYYSVEQLQQRDSLQRELEELQQQLAAAVSADRQPAIKQRIAEKEKQLKAISPARTPVMRELPAEKQRQTFMHVGGSFLNPGQQVQPGVPATFPGLPTSAPVNRLSVAQWLVSRQNPLTARVTVNRFWEQFFGIGIVETSEDFGTQGMPPSNSALLDWLAIDFMEQGWSMKKLCRRIVTSTAYRQSSKIKPETLKKDPYNRLISRGPRFRMEAEMLRDQALAVSGLLSRKLYGPSVMPPQPEGIWQVVYSGDRWVTSSGEDRYRRGLYTFWRRTSPYPSMIVMDATSREVCTLRRIRTNTPLAALVTLNDPVYVEAAQALARRIMREGGATSEERIQQAFLMTVGRPARQPEIQRILSLLDAERKHYAEKPQEAEKMAASILGPPPQELPLPELAAWTVVGNVLLNLDEFLVKD